MTQNNHSCDCYENHKQRQAEAALFERTDALGGQLDLVFEISSEIETAMHAFQDTPPDTEVMKSKAAELVKIAKDVQKKVNAF